MRIFKSSDAGRAVFDLTSLVQELTDIYFADPKAVMAEEVDIVASTAALQLLLRAIRERKEKEA